MMPAEATTTNLLLSELLAGIADIDPADDCAIHNLSLDSRAIMPGDLFLACAGTQTHGLRYAEQAIQRGATAILWEDDGKHAPDRALQQKYQAVTWLAVPNMSQQVGVIAERFFGEPSRAMTVFGVTGTNGKTSVSQFLAQALNQDHPCGVIGTLGNGLVGQLRSGSHTTPDAVSLHALFDSFRNAGARYTVMEVSSHGLDQGRVAGVNFNTAIFTNLSRDHLDYHGDMASYAAAKRRLFELSSVKQAIINADDEFGRDLIQSLDQKVEVISYGIAEDSTSGFVPTVTAYRLTQDHRGIHFRVESSWGKGQVNSPLLGRFNVSNLLAVLATLLAQNIPFAEALKRIEQCRTVAGRMERVDCLESQPLVVVDYAHTPDALEKALSALRDHMPSDSQGKLWCVFGCGGDRDRGKRSQMGAVAERLADHVIVTNDNPRSESPQAIADEILQGMQKPLRADLLLNREIAIRKALTEASNDDVILIAGKGHERYQIINGNTLYYVGDVALVREFFRRIEHEDFHL
jgi:UDP-N-acetylmuramoyl-L-alanyl-D-glutamate--2,6-diaminopimelate ligase